MNPLNGSPIESEHIKPRFIGIDFFNQRRHATRYIRALATHYHGTIPALHSYHFKPSGTTTAPLKHPVKIAPHPTLPR